MASPQWAFGDAKSSLYPAPSAAAEASAKAGAVEAAQALAQHMASHRSEYGGVASVSSRTAIATAFLEALVDKTSEVSERHLSMGLYELTELSARFEAALKAATAAKVTFQRADTPLRGTTVKWSQAMMQVRPGTVL